MGTRARKLLWILAVGFLLDLAFIQLDRMYLQGRLDERFSLDNEAGHAETCQNSNELVLYIFLDDTFQLHETLGEWIRGHAGTPAAFGSWSRDGGGFISQPGPK